MRANLTRLGLALLVALAPASAASCDEWFHGKVPCPDKCSHPDKAAEVLEGMNTALDQCLTKTKPWSSVPVVSGVAKSKCIEGISDKLRGHYTSACSGVAE